MGNSASIVTNQDSLQFFALRFDQLSASDVYQILKLRQDVFILEQTCLYSDIDEKDSDCLHVMGCVDGKLMAYARILPQGLLFEEVAIGRICVAKSGRKAGYGHEIMSFAVDKALEEFNTSSIRISAQAYLESFYQRHGFVVCSKPYEEDDIPHIEMIYEKRAQD